MVNQKSEATFFWQSQAENNGMKKESKKYNGGDLLC